MAATTLAREFPFSLFFVAVAMSAWFGGLRQGILAVVLAPSVVAVAGPLAVATPERASRADQELRVASDAALTSDGRDKGGGALWSELVS